LGVQVKNTLSKRLVIVLAASLLAASCFAADDPGDPNGGAPKEKEKKTPKQMVSSSVKASEAPIPRVWIGLTGSYTPLKLLHANSNGLQDQNTGETINAVGAQGQAGGGAILNARIFRSYWISVGAIYRFNGYDTTDATNDTNGDLFFERSRVRLVDFPVMIRYTGRKWNVSKYTFYELGAVYRDVLSRKTINEWVDSNGYEGQGPSSGTTYRRNIVGAVAGAGVIGRDDFGIIVSPEVRYTRWMGETFNSPVLNSQRNQLEITVSFGF
jgi:hypothetical protein